MANEHTNWKIVPEQQSKPPWVSWVGNCSRQHAETVLEQLEAEPTVPNGLILEEVKRLPHDPAPRRLWWKFWGPVNG